MSFSSGIREADDLIRYYENNHTSWKASLTDSIEMNLDEADRQAAMTEDRLSHETAFSNVRSAVHGKLIEEGVLVKSECEPADFGNGEDSAL